ncbi:MAG: Spy/CpxP family protein refolding chaperone [Lentisphaerae bacterium]|nr:Spy/CpxP family protein refolding chaperone [Lentisphaerota bacterium]
MKRTIGMVGLLVLGSALVASGEPTGATGPAPQGKGPASHSGGKMSRLAQELGLSEEKAAALKALVFENRKKLVQLKADRDLAKMDLEQLLEADIPDEKAVLQAVDKMGQIHMDMARLRVRALLEMAKTLTPEQRAKFKELREGMMQRRSERMGGQRGGFPQSQGSQGGMPMQPGNRRMQPGNSGPSGEQGPGQMNMPPPSGGPGAPDSMLQPGQPGQPDAGDNLAWMDDSDNWHEQVPSVPGLE